MNGVEEITIPRDVARAKLKAFRENVHKDAEAIYKRAAEAYEEALKGRPLIDLANVYRNPATDEKGRPRLAIARADRAEVCLHAARNGTVYNFDSRQTPIAWRGSPQAPQLNLFVPRETPATWSTGYAAVPMVPADVRPRHGQLRSWFILWEVDHWADRSKFAPPPVDPFLLKHCGGTLYAVVAKWDLTPLERAVMAEALRA